MGKTRLTTLYVTHNIQEAVMLADRVVLLSRRPGKVSKILQIAFRVPSVLSLSTQTKFRNLSVSFGSISARMRVMP